MIEVSAETQAFCKAHGSGLLLAKIWHRNCFCQGRIVEVHKDEIVIEWPGGEQYLSRAEFDKQTSGGYLDLLD